MANELVIHHPTGATLYALLFDATGQIYNGSTFGAPSSASWTGYGIAMSEAATATGIYRADMPAVAAGAYGWVVRKQAGGSPAVGDIAVGAGSIRWTGTAEEAVPAAVNVTYSAGVALAGRLAENADVSPLALEATAQAILEDTGTTLPTAIAAIEPGGGSYAGDGIGYYSDTIDDGTSPLDGVRVQLYTSPNRVGPAYEVYTNALGVFEMWPDPGTYYRWLDLAGYNFSQDVAVTVTEP